MHCVQWWKQCEQINYTIHQWQVQLVVSENGILSFALPDMKLNKTFECNYGSGIKVISQSLTSTNTNLTEVISLTADKPYLVTTNTVLSCSNYEQVLMGFTSTPNLVISIDTAWIINIPLNNPLFTTLVSGSYVITQAKTGTLTIEVLRSSNTSITHYFTELRVNVVEL